VSAAHGTRDIDRHIDTKIQYMESDKRRQLLSYSNGTSTIESILVALPLPNTAASAASGISLSSTSGSSASICAYCRAPSPVGRHVVAAQVEIASKV